MNWVKKYKLPVIGDIKYNGHLCKNLDKLWQALYQFYNVAQDRPINIHLLDKFPSHQQVE